MTARTWLVYLDQHIWVNLLQGIVRQDPTAQLVHELLIAQRDDDTIRVPLSGSHYLETWHRRDERSRHELASLMRDISRYDTLAPVHIMEEAGVTWRVGQLAGHGSAVPVPTSLLLGRGVNHAFGSSIGRFRVVSSIADGATPEGSPVAIPPALAEAAVRAGDAWEWFNLAGPGKVLQVVGIEVRPEHRLGRVEVADELALRQRLIDDKAMRCRLEDLIIAEELVRILDYIKAACEGLDTDPVGLLLEKGPEAIRSFIRSVPVTNVHYRLRLHRHRDFAYPIEQHDRTDLQALALAVPYCDVAVTERRWCHAIRIAGLDRLYNTEVCASLKELAIVLQR